MKTTVVHEPARKPAIAACQRVVAVSGEGERERLIDALGADASDLGVIFIESIAGAYTRIKQVAPYLVIVFCPIDDAAACRLLSTLTQDADLRGLPVMTFVLGPRDREIEDLTSDILGDLPRLDRATAVN